MSRRILLLLLLWGSFSPGEHFVDSKCVMSESNVASFHPCIARVNARLKTVPCAYSTSECAAPTVPTASRVQATVIPSAGDSTGGDEQISDIVSPGSSESGSSRYPDSSSDSEVRRRSEYNDRVPRIAVSYRSIAASCNGVGVKGQLKVLMMSLIALCQCTLCKSSVELTTTGNQIDVAEPCQHANARMQERGRARAKSRPPKREIAKYAEMHWIQ